MSSICYSAMNTVQISSTDCTRESENTMDSWTGLTQNVEELLKSDTARLMLANSEFLILLNQASTDREELAALLNISENQLSYITNVSVGSGLIRCSGNIVPFENTFPKNTDLYKLMTTKPGES